jgi:uncharacterized protein (TIGR02246 family)
MDQSPIERVLAAINGGDADAATKMFADDGELLMVDGTRAHGIQQIRELIEGFVTGVRSSEHRVTAQWHQEDVWIAEVEADYELQDRLRLSALPRALVLRERADAIATLHVYGAHEHSLLDRPTGEEGMWIGERWIPPL